MFPIIHQGIERLRGDEHNPVRSLDEWMLTVLERRPPSTTRELADSAEVRMGPRGSGPEIDGEHVVLWVRDAADRRLLEAVEVDADPAPRWRVTAAGRDRRARLRAPKARLGGALGWALRMPSRWATAVERLREQEGVDVGKPPPSRAGQMTKIRPSPGDAPIEPARARENLEQIEHIVVLMMENRSFDHMLGYLSLIDGQGEVRGLREGLKNTHGGRDFPPAYLESTAFPKSMDPPHGKSEIEKQINGGKMDGFVESFARANDVVEPERVMGYYTHRELPVYDHLAQRFVLCDQWFCSVPSATWPNRLFAVAGTCDPEREGIGGSGELFYDLRSFVQLLENEESPDTWRWYSWDPGSLRMVDGRYRLNAKAGFHHDHFRRVAQHAIEPGGDGHGISLGTGFLEDAARGDLPRVAWIDPNFVDLSILDANSNDDHPPSDVRAGQELVMLVYRALVESPCWKDTMLVVTYDEHGGFYDHEPPPRPPEDEPPFPTYGVRVPAFVVSPFVEPGTVSHTVFDHTSITRTILERFGVEGAVEEMAREAPRVGRAEHLGRLLTRRPAASDMPPDLSLPSTALEAWRHRRADRRSAAARALAVRGAREEAEEVLTGFPEEFLDGARTLRDEGLPAGHP